VNKGLEKEKGLFWLTVLEIFLACILGSVAKQNIMVSMGSKKKETRRDQGPDLSFKGTPPMTYFL
jgi:hypothetical protein